MEMKNDRVFLGKGSHTSEHFAAAALGLGCIVRHRASLIERHIESRRGRMSLARLIVARISHAFSYSGSTNTSFLDTSVQNTSCTASSASATESSREAASRTSMRPYSHTSRSMRSSSVTVVPPFFACVLHLQPITRFRRRFYFIPSTLRAIADEIVAEKSLATHQYERQTSQMIMIKVT